mmetsp:Transcript_16677/g.39239  ORF Transcript_16677/g.39239 Transcript_16677/m.39239 type:complete len:227 (-) Transcript_16677:145-825(-)
MRRDTSPPSSAAKSIETSWLSFLPVLMVIPCSLSTMPRRNSTSFSRSASLAFGMKTPRRFGLLAKRLTLSSSNSGTKMRNLLSGIENPLGSAPCARLTQSIEKIVSRCSSVSSFHRRQNGTSSRSQNCCNLCRKLVTTSSKLLPTCTEEVAAASAASSDFALAADAAAATASSGACAPPSTSSTTSKVPSFFRRTRCIVLGASETSAEVGASETSALTFDSGPTSP